VKIQLRFLSGARAGQVEVLGKAYIGLGRHPLSDARFDADRDLDVSSHHAAIIYRGDRFTLRDLGSKNGTFVNRQPVTADVDLKDGDVIGFGAHGPSVEFHILERETQDVSPALRASAERMSSPRELFPAAAAPAGSSTAIRIAAEVRRQTRGLRRTTKALLGLLILAAAGFASVQWQSARHTRELNRMQAHADSLTRTEQELVLRFQSELQSVRDALRDAEHEATRLRAELAAAGATRDPAAKARLRDRLDSAAARQRGLTDAVAVDYRAIARDNVDAIALVVVKFSEREIFSGTAFAVDSQGTLVTNRHVLVGANGDRQPLEIAVKFSGSKQWFRARIIGVSQQDDLGLLKVDIRGGTPRVAGLVSGPALQRGDPVAVIGYPLGEDLPMERQEESAVADPTLTVGTVSKVLGDLVQLDGYGAPGSSGSPVFDRAGLVVGVVYGGERESRGKIIYAVPGNFVKDLLRTLR
jgi:S1-C subfamily serine protease